MTTGTKKMQSRIYHCRIQTTVFIFS